MTESTGWPSDMVRLCYSFFCGGMANLWTTWIQADCAASRESIANLIETFILSYYQMLESGTYPNTR